MVVLWVIIIFLVSTCSTDDFKQSMCGRFEMTKEVISKDAIYGTLRKTYKTASGQGLCAQLCYGDDRCNGILVSPDTCYLFGVFNVTHSSLPQVDYDSYDVFKMNRCRNNGIPDANGYCICPRGYGGPFCENIIRDICYNTWQEVYRSDTSQSIDGLEKAIDKIELTNLKYIIDDKKIVTVKESASYSEGIWSESVYELNKSSWKTFAGISQRMFRVMANAIYQVMTMVNLKGDKISRTLTTVNVTWYNKELAEESQCLHNTKGLSVPEASLLLSRIQNGSSLGSSCIITGGNKVVIEKMYSMGKQIMGSYLVYQPNLFWFLERYISTGYRAFVPWKVGGGKFKSNVTKKYAYKWCTDDCWLKIFSADEFGNGLHGSVSLLARALLSGHKLRVHIKGMAANTKSVYIRGQTISAALQEIMDPVKPERISLSGTALRKIVSSNGEVQTRRYTFETDSVLGDLQEHLAVVWFVDTREWISVLSIARSGQVVSGSLSHLRQEVLNGASVRIVLTFASGMYQIVDADHIEVYSNGHVAAEIIYHVNVQYEDNYITFESVSKHHLWSAIVTTESDFNTFLYTYKRKMGKQYILTTHIDKYSWFIQK